ncbi:MAG TPA: YciI family protein [Woeseiaceae bacterium]|nr:YciI family protein [Woeseiaceae bacterium]
MKYLALVYVDEEKLADAPADETLAYAADLGKRGKCHAAEALRAAHTATTVRVRDDRVAVSDGPLAGTKEHLAGFYVLDSKDLDEAIRLAAYMPPAKVASIELRPLVPGGWPRRLPWR